MSDTMRKSGRSAAQEVARIQEILDRRDELAKNSQDDGQTGSQRNNDRVYTDLVNNLRTDKGESGDKGESQLIPIISNSLRNDWILDGDFNNKIGFNKLGPLSVPGVANIEQKLAQDWAREVDYPFRIPSNPESLNKLLSEQEEDIEENKIKYGRDTRDLLTNDNFKFETDLERTLTQIVRNFIGVARLGQFNYLARVAQYNRISTGTNKVVTARERAYRANCEYLKFLKNELINKIARSEANELAQNLRNNMEDDQAQQRLQELLNLDELLKELDELKEMYSVSDLVHDLGYPKFNAEHPDLLRMLARLPIKIYVTTSYYNFLERVLQAEGKAPITQVCFFREGGAEAEGVSNSKINPTVETPLVYHLFGSEKYPASMVISVDDYLNFLINIAQEATKTIPGFLIKALNTSSIILLGYRLQDWDFQVLFRSIIMRENKLRKYSVAIQLDPGRLDYIRNIEIAERYLMHYFGEAKLDVVWEKTDEFIKRLCRCYCG